MAPRSSNPAKTTAQDARSARLQPQLDRAARVAAMLDRWAAEEVTDEPEWDVSELEPLSLRPPST